MKQRAAMTDDEREAAIEEMIADPAKLKAELMAAARAENPNLTEAQLEALWRQAEEQLL